MNAARTLVLATRNQGKIAEMQRLLDSLSSEIQVRSSFEFNLGDVEETGSTFEENALLKATTIARATGFPALADDSGLCVEVLGGAPGIFSARWAGTHGDDQANIEKLLGDLRKIPSEQRSAKFVCVIALALPNGESEVVRGELNGEIRFEPSGTNGFGYDPIFQPLGHQRTLAEMEPEEKDSISHRGFALREIAPRIAPFISR